jgi:hypothetical protein
LARLKNEKVRLRRGSTTTCSLVPGNLVNRVPDYWYAVLRTLEELGQRDPRSDELKERIAAIMAAWHEASSLCNDEVLLG